MRTLTDAERLGFETRGYLLVPDLIPRSRIDELRRVLKRAADDPGIRETAPREIESSGDPFRVVKPGRPFLKRLGNLFAYHPSVVDLACDESLASIARELVGGPIFVEQVEGLVQGRDPELLPDRYPLPCAYHSIHRAVDPRWGVYRVGDRVHSLLVKALVYLTDIGPGDGGTMVCPGSHLLHWDPQTTRVALESAPDLVDVVTAPRGSVLFFSEGLYHATATVSSHNERCVVWVGYGATVLRMENGGAVPAQALAGRPDDDVDLLTGRLGWGFSIDRA